MTHITAGSWLQPALIETGRDEPGITIYWFYHWQFKPRTGCSDGLADTITARSIVKVSYVVVPRIIKMVFYWSFLFS
jgi:hypothetical protein